MNGNAQQNHRRFIPRVGPLLRLVRRDTPLQALQRAEQEAASRCKREAVANSKAYPTPAVAEMAAGTRVLLSIVAKQIMRAIVGGASLEFGRDLCRALWDFNDFVWAVEHDRPVPPCGGLLQVAA